MEQIIDQYGKIIIPIVVVVALVAIVSTLTSNGGVVDGLFQNMINGFAAKSGVSETIIPSLPVL